MRRKLTKSLLTVGTLVLSACAHPRYNPNFKRPPEAIDLKEFTSEMTTIIYDSIDSYNKRLDISRQRYFNKLNNNIPLTEQERLWLGHVSFRKGAIRELENCISYYNPYWPENSSLTFLEMARLVIVGNYLVSTSNYADVEQTHSKEELTRQTGEWYSLAQILQAKNVGACAPINQ